MSSYNIHLLIFEMTNASIGGASYGVTHVKIFLHQFACLVRVQQQSLPFARLNDEPVATWCCATPSKRYYRPQFFGYANLAS
eukprot:21250_4